MHRVGVLSAGGLALLALMISPWLPTAAAAAPVVYGAPGSVWRTPVPAGAPTDTRSSAAVGELVAEAKNTSNTAYVNTGAYTSQVLQATPSTPRVGVYVGLADGSQPTYVAQVQNVMRPGPPAAMTGIPDPRALGWVKPPANDSDQEYVAICALCASPDGSRVGMDWELWRFGECDPATALGAAGIANGYAWCARWGGRDSGVAQSPGYPTRDWEGFAYPAGPDPFTQTNAAAKYEDPRYLATATSLPNAAGEITVGDVNGGAIRHPLGLSVIYPVKGHVWPAQRDDGWASASHAVLEGMHFVLDPAFNCGGLARAIGRMACVALQRYGAIVWDKAGALTVRADPRVRQTSSWPTGTTGSNALAGIPWSRMRLLVPGN